MNTQKTAAARRVSDPAGRLRGGLWLFAGLSWLHMLTVSWEFFRAGAPTVTFDGLSAFHLAVWLSYSFLYVLPGLLLTWAAVRFLGAASRWTAVLAVVCTSLCLLFIRTDAVIYNLYDFHFNGFVVNLVLTPGGIASLGGGGETYWTIAGIVVGHVALQAAAWYASRRLPLPGRAAPYGAVFCALIVAAALGERLAYGIADIHNDGRILDAVKIYPFYMRTKIRSLAAHFGVTPAPRQREMAVDLSKGRLNYPAGEIKFAAVKNPPNIVILAAESLRWDRMTETIMPNTWKLAQQGQYFRQHYSSGNGTREALFGLFYGLYGSYWSNFLYAQRSPLLMDRLQELGYQFDLRTSAKFTYPEFDRTLFAKIPADLLHESDSRLAPWEQDQKNTDQLIEFLRTRDRQRPFMSFFFFESTHARYSFPETAVIARPYLESVNYAAMSRESLLPQIGQLLNRYTNAAHWIDVQMGRIYAELARQGLLDNTIVIVTGDHGEEFMEKGAWGHNSTFVEEQIHTPMVVWMPGRAHRVIDAVSSHLDIGTTLLQILGAPGESGTYALGRNLFEDLAQRPYVVSSDWHSLCVITPDMKYRLPYTNRGVDHWAPTDTQDHPLNDAEAARILQKNNPLIMDAIRDSTRFLVKNR